MNAFDLLARDNWIILNGTLADNIGIECAILVGLLSSYQRTFGGEFYRDRSQIIQESHLTDYAYRKAMDKLKELGILEVAYKGVPCRCYYKLNEEKLSLQFVEGQQSSFVDFNKSSVVDFNKSGIDDSDKSHINNNKGNNNKDNNNTYEFGETDQIQIMFEQFWKEYPRKVSKKTAFTAFKNIKHLKDEFPIIMQAVKLKKGSNDWRKNGGQYIPHPATFIHQERWKDEEQTISSNDSMLSSDNPYFSKETREMLRSMGR